MNFGINIFNDLNAEKIEYVVWKNTNLIDNFYKGEKDLDIYIHEDYHKRFKFLLSKNNWVEVKSTTNNFKEIRHYLFFENSKILHIHAYFKLFTGNSISKNYDLSNFKNYFQNKHFDNKHKMWILNYDIQLLLFKIRMVLKRKSLLGRYLILREIENYNGEIINIIQKNQSKNNNQNLDLENLNFKQYKISKKLLETIKTFKRVNFIKSFFHELFFIGKIFFQKLFSLKKFKLNKNIIIFISGPDSSGKTTITSDLETLFKNFFKTKKFSIGRPFPKLLIKILIKTNYLAEKQLSISSISNIKNNLSYFKLLKNIILSINLYIYTLNIFYFNQNTNIIILDRYLSENVGDVNGPRNFNNSKNSFLRKCLSYIEVFFYNSTKIVNHEYKILANLENCLSRNRVRYKEVKKNDDEIIERFKNYHMSKFKSKKTFDVDNNSSKKNTLTNILNILSKNINENT